MRHLASDAAQHTVLLSGPTRDRTLFKSYPICTGEQARAQGVCVVYLAILAGNIADTNSFSVGKCFEIPNNVLARTHSDLEVTVIVEMLEGIDKCMANQ